MHEHCWPLCGYVCGPSALKMEGARLFADVVDGISQIESEIRRLHRSRICVLCGFQVSNPYTPSFCNTCVQRCVQTLLPEKTFMFMRNLDGITVYKYPEYARHPAFAFDVVLHHCEADVSIRLAWIPTAASITNGDDRHPKVDKRTKNRGVLRASSRSLNTADS